MEARDKNIALYDVEAMNKLKEDIKTNPNKYRRYYEHFYSKTTNSWELTLISLRGDIASDEKYLNQLRNFEKSNGETEGQLLMSEVEKMDVNSRMPLLNNLLFYYKSKPYKEEGIDFNVLACISVIEGETERILDFKKEALREYNKEEFIQNYRVSTESLEEIKQFFNAKSIGESSLDYFKREKPQDDSFEVLCERVYREYINTVKQERSFIKYVYFQNYS